MVVDPRVKPEDDCSGSGAVDVIDFGNCAALVNLTGKQWLKAGLAKSQTYQRHQSNQPQPLETHMAILADDDVVVHGDAQWFCGVDDGLRHLDIGA